MTKVCGTVTQVLLTVKKPRPISGRLPVNNSDEMGLPAVSLARKTSNHRTCEWGIKYDHFYCQENLFFMSQNLSRSFITGALLKVQNTYINMKRVHRKYKINMKNKQDTFKS